jgi:hypothetical protein
MVARLLYIAASIWFETTPNGTGLNVSIDDSVRRLVVPAQDDDTNVESAQESIIGCTKDQQSDLPVK